jgi:hypothetical protein
MSNDDSDRGESSIRVVCPSTLEPPEPIMLHFYHMEWGKEKVKIVLPNTYVLF